MPPTLRSLLASRDQDRRPTFLGASGLPPNVSVRTLLHIQAEERRVWLNKRVWRKKQIAGIARQFRGRCGRPCPLTLARVRIAPLTTDDRADLLFAGNNYEAELGPLLPQIADPAWTAERNRILTELDDLSQEAVLYSPIRHHKKLAQYLALRKKCATKFRISFDVDDEWRATLAHKAKELREYEVLLSASNGQPASMDRMAGELFCFTVVNPYRGNDLRRVEFDRYLIMTNPFNSTQPLGPTLTREKFEFYIPNKFLNDSDPEERYLCWCRRHLFEAEILAKVAEAREDARKAAPPPSPFLVLTEVWDHRVLKRKQQEQYARASSPREQCTAQWPQVERYIRLAGSPSLLPRASSPDFPAHVMPGPEAEKALRKEQEPRRKQLNRKIVRLQKELASAPDNAVLKAKLQQSLEDHKDDFGTFIVDKDFGAFAAERTRLLMARKTAAETGLLTRHYGLNPAYCAYYDSRDALLKKYDVDIEPKDRYSETIDLGLEATFFYRGLARQGGGDRDTMKRLALESFTVNLCNPYPQGDRRRADLEATYREHLPLFRSRGWTCHPESDENDFEDVILNYTRGRSFKDALEGFGIAASKDAGILPAALFYGSPAPAAV
ncbi:hypothetical protein B0H16DRAFT_1477772 [Mycena metata]|uniref:Uncharacterized protein n=1 Tax=Mycena metata TaxID=1033252 RepID=A0AAD7H8Y2_9AGAR|nr:hypothetical protein B0H16DRAFT_1477772 [Mycena metata]